MASTVVEIRRRIEEGCRRNHLEQLPPPASSNKPLTPFSIVDILAKPNNKTKSAHLSLSAALLKTFIASPVNHDSPLCALQELTSKTFRGLDLGVFQAAEGKHCYTLLVVIKTKGLLILIHFNCIILVRSWLVWLSIKSTGC